VGAVANGAQTGWVVAHVTADLSLLILLAMVFLAMPADANGPPLLLLGASLGARLAADTAAAQAMMPGLASTPTANLGWMAALILAGGAAWSQRQSLTQATPLGTGERGRRAQAVIKMALPLAATLAVSWYVLIDIRNTGQPDLLGLTVAVLLALVLVARQGVMAGELELRQYAHLVNSAADPAFVCDSTGRLRLVNPALLAATGYAMEALLGQPATMLFAQGVLPLGEKERPERVFVTGWTGEVTWRRHDGTLFPAHLSLRPVPSDYPTRSGLVGTAHDLSDQKRHEATLVAAYDEVAQARRALEDLNTQLEAMVEEKTSSLSDAYERLARQNQTLQTLDELKSEFVSLVSHELRAPLTNIGGGIELVLAGGGDLAPRAKRTLQLVQAEITRLTQFVETILDLSALEAGRLPLYPGPLDIRPMLATVLAQFEARPGADRLRVEWPAELPPVLADERALESVLFHLVDNALKYAPQGEVLISAVAAGSRVEVSVSDRGPGIPPDQVETIFEKFERLDDTDNRDVYGHGLGLYMARRLLEAQGGGIRAASRPEGGARLTCWVPIVEGNDAE
jgi:PAS domain S-box-containing protein